MVKLLKIALLSTFLFASPSILAQLTDDFADGDFSANPAWSGDIADYTVNGINQLQLNASVAGTSYISTPVSITNIANAEWYFQVRLNFAASTSNFARIYLVSDQPNLETNLNGYFLQLGETGSGDVFRLYRKTGATNTIIASGVTTLASAFHVDVKVTRDNAGLWTYYVKSVTSSSFGASEATVTDATHSTTSHFGFVSIYTVSNIQNFYFDNITVTSPPDLSSPSVSGINVLSESRLQINFNESVSTTSAGVAANYVVSTGINSPSNITVSGTASILDFANTFSGSTLHYITISGISDLSSNVMSAYVTTFIYTVTTPSAPATVSAINFRELVINEIMADPSTILGSTEYLEIYNTTNRDIALQGLVLIDGTTHRTINQNVTISALGYMVIVPTSAERTALLTDVPGIQVITLTGFGLTNGGEALQLTLPGANLIDSYTYASATKGKSWEQINPLLTTSGSFNWALSNATIGGTPGTANMPLTVGGGTVLTIPSDLAYRELVISEIMADPTGFNPAVEYLEIYNNGTRSLPLTGLILRDGTTNRTINYPVTVPASGYIVLVPNEADKTALLNIYPSIGVISLSGLSLTNSGEAQTLQLPSGTIIDSYTYPSATAGKAFEIRNPILTCSGTFNWTVTGAAAGGTPGTQNAAYSLAVTAMPISTTGISIINQSTLGVSFSSTFLANTATVSGNYIVSNSINNPMLVTLTANNTSATIAFNTIFVEFQSYTITISGIADPCGNTGGTRTFNFTYFPPVTYPGIGYRDVVINEIMADVSPAPGGVPAFDYIELYNKTNQTLLLNHLIIRDYASTGTYTDRNFPSNATIAGQAFAILCAAAAKSVFETSLPGVNIYTISGFAPSEEDKYALINTFAGNNTIDVVDYKYEWYRNTAKDDGGFALEQINPNTPCSGATNWSVTGLAKGGTPGAVNSIFSNTTDNTAPTVKGIYVASINQIKIGFSESMDSTTLKNSILFMIAGVSITGAVPNASSDSVSINFTPSLIVGNTYNISITGLRDCPGNTMTATSLQFGKGLQALPYQIIINEIYPDETPSFGLPAGEFVELKNNTNKIIDISGYKIKDATSEYIFPEGSNILPNEYVIVTAATKASLFQPYGKVIVPASFSSTLLNNDGDEIKLTNAADIIIDQMKYTSATYRDDSKNDGGYTLEKINPAITCTGDFNWKASNAPTGGTPGAQNSVLDAAATDTQIPTIKNSYMETLTRLMVIFSENMDSASVINVSNIISNTLAVNTIAVRGALKDTLEINFNQLAVEGTPYVLTLTSGYKDCSGNALITSTVSFGMGKKPARKNLIINELYPDENPSLGLPLGEFLELHNTTNQLLDLSGCSIGDDDDRYEFPEFTTISPNGYIIICASSKSALYQSYGKVISPSGYSSTFLSNEADLVILRNASGAELDRVSYTTAWYGNADKEDGGYTIERINPNAPCSSAANWKASVSSVGGTPGSINSVYSLDPDKVAPALIGNAVKSTKYEIGIAFSEPLDSASVSNAVYSPGTILSIVSFNQTTPTLDSILVSFNAVFETGVQYTLTLSGLKDCEGNILTTTAINFGIGRKALKNEIIINELMPDESPVAGLPEAEFVEIFNTTSDLISLNAFTLTDPSSKGKFPENAYILPKEHLILTSNSKNTLFTSYGRVYGLSSFPSLNSSGDFISLKDSNEAVINSVNYLDDWYSDPKKGDGGYTLERINPYKNCGGRSNWNVTKDESGGTPGKQNSIFSTGKDGVKPTYSGTYAISNQSFAVAFSEALDADSLKLADFSVAGILLSSYTLSSMNADTLLLSTQETLDSNKIYNLNINKIQDCSGESTGGFSFESALGVSPKKHRVAINEIMADPKPSIKLPEYEYIELYNASDSLYNLQGCYLYIDKSKVIIPAGIFIKPKNYLIVTNSKYKNEFTKYGLVAGLDGLSSITDNDEKIILTNNKGLKLSQVAFDAEWYGNSEKDNGGWSLERIDPTNPCAEATNWKASINADGGTPGKLNSIYATIPDNTAPTIKVSIAVAADTLEIKFDEIIDSLSALKANYLYAQNLSSQISKINEKSVVLVLNPALQLQTPYHVSVTGVKDCKLNSKLEAREATFFLTQKPDSFDVVINELLFNPNTNGQRFVEIYNRSSKYFNMRNWDISSLDKDLGTLRSIQKISRDNELMRPAEYKVLSVSKENIKNFYPKAPDSTFININSFPSLGDKANNEGIVMLLTPERKTLDRFDYYDDYHTKLLSKKDGVSLERVNANMKTNDEATWQSAAATVGYATPGYVNSQNMAGGSVGEGQVTLSAKTFTPDEDGINDVLYIYFNFPKAGYSTNVTIIDVHGNITRRLKRNEIAGTMGTYEWDGTSDEGTRVRSGYYSLWVQVYDDTGKVTYFRDKVVVNSTY
ncbi:MAG: lamin tail domain-containing protein [Cytophagales bacterium]|nr:lamin tail domain-containing protein [Cytophagales bacterium]